MAAFPQWDHFEKRSRSAGRTGDAEVVIFRVFRVTGVGEKLVDRICFKWALQASKA